MILLGMIITLNLGNIFNAYNSILNATWVNTPTDEKNHILKLIAVYVVSLLN